MDKKLLTISIAAYNVQNYITETLMKNIMTCWKSL